MKLVEFKLSILSFIVLFAFSCANNNKSQSSITEPKIESKESEDINLESIETQDLLLLESSFYGDVLRNPNNTYYKRILAQVKYRLNKKEETFKLYEQIIKTDSLNCSIYNELGYFEQNEGLTSNALKNFTKAINLCPDSSKYLMSRGVSFFENKEYQSALKDLNYYIQRNPKDLNGYYWRAKVNYQLNNFEAACKDSKVAGLNSEEMKDLPKLKDCF